MEDMSINIKPQDTKSIKCENCEGEIFQEVFFLRKISKLLTGQINDQIIPLPTFQCIACGHINKEFTPKIGNK